MSSEKKPVEEFSLNALVDKHFIVNWAATTKELVNRTRKDGSTYQTEQRWIEVRIKDYEPTFRIGPVQVRNYEALRMLALSGIKTFGCTKGMPKSEDDFAPYIFSGVSKEETF